MRVGASGEVSGQVKSRLRLFGNDGEMWLFVIWYMVWVE